MTDIKIKIERYADKENLKKLMRYSKAKFANKSEINEKFYTKEQIDTMLESGTGGTGGGGTCSDCYTKSEIDTKLDSKANTSDLSAVATSGSYNDLLDKPTSFDVDLSNYYTKSEVDNLLSNISPITSTITIYDLIPDGAEAHNSMWGGRDITAAFDSGEFSEHVADGSFKDIFPGDYITKSNINWVIADCDYWINKGDTAMKTHHVVIVPQEHPRIDTFYANMNAANTTEGGYAGSRMYRETMPAFAKGLAAAFGSDHILTFRDHLTRDLNTSAISSGITVFTGAPNWNGAWYSQQCNLMSEAMVYGSPHCASSALDNIMATRQMSAFRLSEKLINYSSQWWWLRDVVSSENFAVADGTGVAFAHLAGYIGSVRPFALLC